jgi:hypothetical protein
MEMNPSQQDDELQVKSSMLQISVALASQFFLRKKMPAKRFGSKNS